jgi:hypothetical protein
LGAVASWKLRATSRWVGGVPKAETSCEGSRPEQLRAVPRIALPCTSLRPWRGAADLEGSRLPSGAGGGAITR